MRIDILPRRDDAPTAAERARVGLLGLATDLNSEADLRRMLPADVGLYCNRIRHANPMTLETLRGVADDLPRAGRDLLPGLELDVVVYGCTSGTIALGEAETLALIRHAKPSRHQTTPVTASLAALARLGARRVSILTPYRADVNRALGDYYASRGLEVVNVSGLDMDDDYAMTALAPATIVEAGLRAMAPEADALFVSCTALRASLAVEALEAALGRPVVTSNQAIVWHTLDLVGLTARDAPGRLFDTLEEHIPQ
ncbi:maleate cis-trans isomerase family protein [Aromatoleum petrolei]|uniref:Asp/Glu racemase n=1 Tax=Aromatoleum petrolei TaxID=76116 RepID=A0ABX1MTS9_9RHOO|nr:aspartate/glutamate racemase family protein [Aromatoleum petrolei]NMF89489.1 Asp/Glu racemase [Aromatoleum petrolei]QTQ36252.1 Putative Asp/Glu racemase [Aromatoleum petrolei]